MLPRFVERAYDSIRFDNTAKGYNKYKKETGACVT